jgi:hypothetical protein
MSEAKRAKMGVASPLLWDHFVEENKEDDFFFTGPSLLLGIQMRFWRPLYDPP